jgi:hypothetical protein
MHQLRPELARRIVYEAEAVCAKFPGRFQLCLGLSGQPEWRGCVPVEGRECPISVAYPTVYPAVPPALRTNVLIPPGCPHVLGRSCAPNTDNARRRWNPNVHTAATVMRAAQRWFLAFLVWGALGSWPVPDAWDGYAG